MRGLMEDASWLFICCRARFPRCLWLSCSGVLLYDVSLSEQLLLVDQNGQRVIPHLVPCCLVIRTKRRENA